MNYIVKRYYLVLSLLQIVTLASFQNKQEQDEDISKWTDATLKDLVVPT